MSPRSFLVSRLCLRWPIWVSHLSPLPWFAALGFPPVFFPPRLKQTPRSNPSHAPSVQWQRHPHRFRNVCSMLPHGSWAPLAPRWLAASRECTSLWVLRCRNGRSTRRYRRGSMTLTSPDGSDGSFSNLSERSFSAQAWSTYIEYIHRVHTQCAYIACKHRAHT